MKKLLFIIICLFSINANAIEKETTFDKKLFDKAQSEGKIVVVSSWMKYCSSCANQIKVLQRAKKEGELLDIKFDNIEYFSFDVTNREIADFFNIQYQTTLLIFKGDNEGEGLIGIKYKIYEDEDGLIKIQSNPLSILAPGILQRVF